MGLQNVLGHDMLGHGPVRFVQISVRISQGRHVVEQGVEPDVGDVGRVPRERDPPVEARAADREVAQPRLDQPERLVGAVRRLDRVRVRR